MELTTAIKLITADLIEQERADNPYDAVVITRDELDEKEVASWEEDIDDPALVEAIKLVLDAPGIEIYQALRSL